MSAFTKHPADLTTATVVPQPSIWRAGIGYGLIASAATTALAALAHAAGVSLDVGGEPIVLTGFAVVTFVFVVLGLGIAAGIRRWSPRPRRTWVRTTVVLTALSFIPDALADAAVSTRFTLMLTHVVAAAIVIPALARRLSD